MMRTPHFAFAVSLCAIALTAGAGLARSSEHGGRMSFEALDLNKDGQISREEMYNVRRNRITEADSNNDGAISLEELEQQAITRARNHAERIMARADTNGDGLLTGDELKMGDRADRRFQRLDRNGDGTVSKAEFDCARERMGHGHRAPDAD